MAANGLREPLLAPFVVEVSPWWPGAGSRKRRVPLSPALREEIARGGHRIVPFAANSPGSFSRRIKRHTGIPDFHVHRCRHTFAMRWLEAGGNLAALQYILGHRDLTTTMRYARITDAFVEQEAARVDRMRARR